VISTPPADTYPRRCGSAATELLLPELAELGEALTMSLGVDSFADATARGAAMDLHEVACFLASS
jgi:hypothetical protein